MEYVLSNVSNYNIANIADQVYVFSNIVSGDPYRIVAEVYDTHDFQHILTDVRLGDTNSEYFWPTDNVDGLDFTLETEAQGISYTIMEDIIRSDEIPLFISANITDPLVQNYTLEYDLYAEPVLSETYKPHRKKKYITNQIANLDGHLTRYYMGGLDTLVGYNIYYSLKINPPDDPNWYFIKAHALVAENVVTIDPGFHVEITPLEPSSVESIRFRRVATEFYLNRFMKYHIEEFSLQKYLNF
jgi:hypothetical protein